MSKKILFINEAHPILVQTLQAANYECVFHYKTSVETIAAILPECIGVVMRSRISMTPELIDRGRQLKFIAREGVGLEHIAVEYAEKKGIKVLISPEGSRDTVGEPYLGLIALLDESPQSWRPTNTPKSSLE